MKNINGFTVIAHKTTDYGIVILGARECQYSDSGYDYATGLVASLDADAWVTGHYMTDLTSALVDFQVR